MQTEILQRFQNGYLRIIINAPWYIINDTLHHDLNVTYVRDEIKRFSQGCADRMKEHSNILATNLMKKVKTICRLKIKRIWSYCNFIQHTPLGVYSSRLAYIVKYITECAERQFVIIPRTKWKYPRNEIKRLSQRYADTMNILTYSRLMKEVKTICRLKIKRIWSYCNFIQHTPLGIYSSRLAYIVKYITECAERTRLKDSARDMPLRWTS